jgi:hypothetical protein
MVQPSEQAFEEICCDTTTNIFLKMTIFNVARVYDLFSLLNSSTQNTYTRTNDANFTFSNT